MSTTESDSTNPYQSPDSHVAAVSTASEVQANPTRRLVHPLNFVILGGLIFIWWLLSDESLASLVFVAGLTMIGFASWFTYRRVIKSRFVIPCVNVGFVNLIFLTLAFVGTGMRVSERSD